MRSQAEYRAHTTHTHTYTYSTFAFISVSHHLFRLSLPPHDICTRVSELVIGYTMSEYTHTDTCCTYVCTYIYANLCMHYQLHSCTQDWQMMWVELKIISHWPLRFLAFPPLPASPHVWCCFIRWLRTGLLARQLKLAVGICNWLFVSLIPQKRVDCMEKEQRRAGVLHTVLECNKWAPSFLLAGKIATATIMQRPHTKCLTHTHTHRRSLACRMRVCFFFFYSNNDSKFV